MITSTSGHPIKASMVNNISNLNSNLNTKGLAAKIDVNPVALRLSNLQNLKITNTHKELQSKGKKVPNPGDSHLDQYKLFEPAFYG